VWAWTYLTHSLVRPASAERACEHEVETLFRLGAGLHAETAPTRDVGRLRPLVVGNTAVPHGCVVVQLTQKLVRLGVDSDKLRAALAAVAQAVPAIAVAAPNEAAFAREIGAACGLDVTVTDTSAAWKALLAGARAVVTPDSGAAHVAGMAGIPCIDLFPDTPDAAAALRRWYPWASPRVWAIAVTGRVAKQFTEQLLAGLDYLGATQPAPVPT
jgi:hypothetical protein